MRNTLFAALIPCAFSLMFKSDAVTKQWDTWAFVENGTFFAYYLVTEVSYGEGFGCATSADGVHWHDHGYVWKGPSWFNHTPQWWQGSSAIWRAADWNATDATSSTILRCATTTCRPLRSPSRTT